MSTISSGIAEWVKATTFANLPPEVVENAKLRALDLTGVMIASRDLAIVQAARKAWSATDPGDSVRPVGSRIAASVQTAALLNGAQASALEFDDTFLPTTMHATGVALSVCYPESQLRTVSGPGLIEALVVASEVMIRTSIVSTQDWRQFGIHPTGSFGVFGGVCGLAKLRDLEQRTTVDALGHAGSMSTMLRAAFEDGTSTKNLHVGFAAANAFRATALAEAGISGPAAVFESRNGWYRAHVQTSEERRYERVTSELGQDWLVLEIAPKLYPVAYTLMPHIEATITLRDKYGIRPEDVVEIDAYIVERSIPALCNPPELKVRPLTTWHGRISLQHTVAEALVRGRMDKRAYSEEAIRDPIINALAAKVRCLPDPQATDKARSRAKVVIRLRDGREVVHEIDDFRGTRRNPITVDDYIAKFRGNVDDILPDPVVQEAIDMFLNLERVDDITALTKSFEV
jgi:2-methylcitrate dehydratase PrpD